MLTFFPPSFEEYSDTEVSFYSQTFSIVCFLSAAAMCVWLGLWSCGCFFVTIELFNNPSVEKFLVVTFFCGGWCIVFSMILFLLFYQYTVRLNENGLTRYHKLFFRWEYNTPLDELDTFEVTHLHTKHHTKWSVTINQNIKLITDVKREKIESLTEVFNEVLNNIRNCKTQVENLQE
ncbi:MAG: hypothetical protein LBU65_06540 [Planctomycetaceae bacterium]|jgi:hypothetical protein|nr:hypothetical protein [Planctomycetaceae bacterium]